MSPYNLYSIALLLMIADPKSDTTLNIDEKDVTVPCGAPKPVGKFKDSNFSQSEYLVYKESQCRIRYMLKMKMY